MLIALAGLGFLAIATFFALGGTAGIASRWLPKFPDLGQPVAGLRFADAGEILFESATPYDLDVILGDPSLAIPTTGIGTLTFPENTSSSQRVPALILLHGSGGISPGREPEYARMLNSAGYAAFVVDYYKPRGVTKETDYMRKVIAVTEFDAITDAYSALRLLSTHPRIDPDRIGLMGFSYGGMATRFAMDDRLREALAPQHPGFAAFIDVYGPCFQILGTRETNGSPLLTLRGTEDASNDLEACRKREDELRALGILVQANVFEGAGHAWESLMPRRMIEEAPYVAGCEVDYDAAGHSQNNGEGIVDVPVETSRPERVVIRLRSGSAMQSCVKSGYVVGRDDTTKAKANLQILGFLSRSFGRRP